MGRKCDQLAPAGAQRRNAVQGTADWTQFLRIKGGRCCVKWRVPDHAQQLTLAQWHTHQAADGKWQLTDIGQRSSDGTVDWRVNQNCKLMAHARTRLWAFC